MTWLLRIASLARQRRSAGRLALMLGVAAACLLLVGIEHLWGWPDWLTVNRMRR